MIQKRQGAAENKAEELQCEYRLLEEEFIQLQEENLEISTAVAALERKLASVSDENYTAPDDTDFTFWTRSGRRYSPTIRKLYYSLLSDQVPSSKIATIIKMVIKCFNPSINVEELKLPQ